MSPSFSSVKTRSIFNGFLSIKCHGGQTFFNNLEIVSPDGHDVLGNFRRKFVLHDLNEFFSHNNRKWKLFVQNCILTRHKTGRRFYNSRWRNTGWLTGSGVYRTHDLQFAAGFRSCELIGRSWQLRAHPVSQRCEHFVIIKYEVTND
jgi:hypothetical protein